MGIRIRLRGTELTAGTLVDYPDATGYTVLEDGTVVLRTGGKNVGAVHRDRWDCLELLRSDTVGEEHLGGTDRR